jgi:branched-chain amino acid transport system substrate-binding protein
LTPTVLVAHARRSHNPVVRAKRIAVVALALAVAGTAAAAQGSSPGVQPLPQSFCAPVVQGAKKPQLLIVSDFPLRFFPFPTKTLQFQAALRYELALRHYTAGRYAIGYQACDDSSPQSGSGALAKCGSNAQAYAQDPSVIGVVGTWNSFCAGAELPILNSAPKGPLALISPTNTDVGLTHAGGGTAPDEPGRYYPTGRRSFARIISPDDAQAVADALLAKLHGAKSAFVLDDGSGYGLDVAVAFRNTLRKIGLRLAGTAEWSPDQASFDALVTEVVKAHPQAVFLGGFECPNCMDMIKALRTGLGPKPPIIASDGFSAVDVALALGATADGTYASVPGLPIAKLPPAGRTIERLFGPPRLGSGGPSYLAQATAVLLDAIAASNGTRASVTAHVMTARVQHGVIGSFGFDRNGDPTFNPIMIFRVADGGHVHIDRVIDTPASLVP